MDAATGAGEREGGIERWHVFGVQAVKDRPADEAAGGITQQAGKRLAHLLPAQAGRGAGEIWITEGPPRFLPRMDRLARRLLVGPRLVETGERFDGGDPGRRSSGQTGSAPSQRSPRAGQRPGKQAKPDRWQ